MTTNGKLFLLLCLVLWSCNTPRKYFNRPNIKPTINNEGTGFRDGQEIDTTNFICVDPIEYDVIQEYYNDKEYRLYICLKYGRCK